MFANVFFTAEYEYIFEFGGHAAQNKKKTKKSQNPISCVTDFWNAFLISVEYLPATICKHIIKQVQTFADYLEEIGSKYVIFSHISIF